MSGQKTNAEERLERSLTLTGPLSLLGVTNANIAAGDGEMKAHGGLLGRPLCLIGRTAPRQTAWQRRKPGNYFQEDRVDALLGGIYTSPRQAINGPVMEGKKLYIYPEQYEGQECHGSGG